MMHEAIDVQIAAKRFERSATERKIANRRKSLPDWRDSEERLQVLKLRWMGLEDEADALEQKLGHSFATKLALRHRVC